MFSAIINKLSRGTKASEGREAKAGAGAGSHLENYIVQKETNAILLRKRKREKSELQVREDLLRLNLRV